MSVECLGTVETHFFFGLRDGGAIRRHRVRRNYRTFLGRWEAFDLPKFFVTYAEVRTACG